MAIDLSASYAAAIRAGLPHAVIVADRFHLVRLAGDTVTAVRQRVIREAEGRRGRKVDPAWRLRRRGVQAGGTPFRVPAAGIVPWLALAVIAFMLTSIRPNEWLVVVVVLAIGAAIFAASAPARRARPAASVD